MVNNGQRVSAEVTNAAFMSRTSDTSTTGKVDVNNATDSTAPTDGALHTQGGLGVEKSANIGQNLNVGGELIVAGESTFNDTINATNILADGNINSATGNVNAFNLNASANVTALNQVSAPSVVSTNMTASGTTQTQTLAVTSDASVGGNLTVNGTLTVSGGTTNINSTNLNVTDKNITVNNGGNDASSEGAGLTVKRTTTDGSLIYKDASATKWAAGSIGSEVDLVGTTSSQTLTNKTISGASNTISNISLTGSVSGVLPVVNGGTNLSSYAAGDLLYSSATNVLSKLPIGSNGQYLSIVAGLPSWQNSSSAVNYTTKIVRASHTTGQTFAANANTPFIYNVESDDPSNLYNPATGVFTADENGLYLVLATIVIGNTFGSSQLIALQSVFNGTEQGISFYNTETVGTANARQCRLFSVGRLNSGQTITVNFLNNGQTNSATTTASNNTLFITKVGN